MIKKIVTLISLLTIVGFQAAAQAPSQMAPKSSDDQQVKTAAEIKHEIIDMKAALKKVKNAKKKTAAEKALKAFQTLNDRMTDHFTDALAQVQKSLNHVIELIARADARSKDTTAAKAAVEKAKKAIDDAKAAVTAQKAKKYQLIVKSDKTLKADIVATRGALQTDLKAVREIVKAAREAVHDAAVALAQVLPKEAAKPAEQPK